MLLDALVEHALTGKGDGGVPAPAADLLEEIDNTLTSNKETGLPGTVQKLRGRPRKQSQPKMSPGFSAEAHPLPPKENDEDAKELEQDTVDKTEVAQSDANMARRSSRASKTVFSVKELLKPRRRTLKNSHDSAGAAPQRQATAAGLMPMVPKKRGRPFKNAENAAKAAAKKAAAAGAMVAGTDGDRAQAVLSIKRRGRPPKNLAASFRASRLGRPISVARHYKSLLGKHARSHDEVGHADGDEYEDGEYYSFQDESGILSELDSKIQAANLSPGDESSFEGRRMELLRWRMSLMAMMKSLEAAEESLARDMAAAAAAANAGAQDTP